MKMIRIINNRYKESYNVNIERFEGNPTELAKQICKRFEWNIENPQLERTDNNLVCNDLSDMNGCDEYLIAELAGNI